MHTIIFCNPVESNRHPVYRAAIGCLDKAELFAEYLRTRYSMVEVQPDTHPGYRTDAELDVIGRESAIFHSRPVMSGTLWEGGSQ